jgi:hypothetical protein
LSDDRPARIEALAAEIATLREEIALQARNDRAARR